MLARFLVALVALAILLLCGLYVLGSGWLGEEWGPGVATENPIPDGVIAARARAQREAASSAGVPEPKQILFGDLHVHTTYSADAFLMSLPMAGGEGARPVADACDFARYCSALDFWSINDHALAITPSRWRQTVEAVRQCNDVAGDPASPDVVGFLGWEWTQIGTAPENHYGHRNVILKHTEEGRIPTRPIAATLPPGVPGRGSQATPSTLALGLVALLEPGRASLDLVRYMQETLKVPPCPEGLPVREIPEGCQESAATPGELFAKLDDWGHDAIVIPHGTTWGFYTPLGSSWDKQLGAEDHDPDRQTLIEVYSGHGNSEEYRGWRDVILHQDGSRSCPDPAENYLPSCWRAGEIIREDCAAAGEPESVCEERAAEARQNYVEADVYGHLVVPGATARDWKDSGQCRDCFLPAFNYRSRSSVQYIMALRNFAAVGGPLRFRFGFVASSDVHSARPGTGYKEVARSEMTERRFGLFRNSILFRLPEREPLARSEPFEPEPGRGRFFGLLETERQASFFLTGGLVGAHTAGRSREAIWEALERREVYGTSGPRILLWFDLVDEASGRRIPMGSEVATRAEPRFEVRAVGSFEQKPGCPDYAAGALSPGRLGRLCAGECYHPSNRRRRISRIEVIRIRPQAAPGEAVDGLIEDPWRVFPCAPDPAGCRAAFSDPDFVAGGRDTLYYVRAVEAPSLAVDADGVGCLDAPLEEDCLGEVEERAWSSPIFVDFEGG